MQRSFHVGKKYEHLIPFIEQQKNLSKYLCELISKDYTNQLIEFEAKEISKIISEELRSSIKEIVDANFMKIILENLLQEENKKRNS